MTTGFLFWSRESEILGKNPSGGKILVKNDTAILSEKSPYGILVSSNEHATQYRFPEKESKIFYLSFATDVVGARRRQALPGLPEGSDAKILHRQVF
jgi:hypothetical protein